MSPTQNTKPQPVLVASTIMAMLMFVSGGLAALGVNSTVVAAIALGVGALNFGVGVYVRGLVVPYVDTAAYRNDEGTVVAGPAAPVKAGKPVAVSAP